MEKEKIFVGQITQKAVLKYKGAFILVKEKTHPMNENQRSVIEKFLD